MSYLESQISGIPCLIEVTEFEQWTERPGYYKCTELDYEVRDRRGRLAPWLKRKLTRNDHDRIVGEIIDALE